MWKAIIVLVCVLGCASLAAAQTAGDYPRNEFFGGYSFNSADVDTLTVQPERAAQHGFIFEYTRNVTRHVGLTLDLSAHFDRDSFTNGGLTFDRKRDQYHVLGGVQYKARNDGRVTPFVHALAGGALFRGFAASRTAAGNFFFIDDDTSFAMAFGGGLDVRVSKRAELRLIQADYNPTFFGRGRQDNFRLSFGVVFGK